MKLTKTLSLVALSSLMVACMSANIPQKLDTFVDKTEQNCENYDADDWKKSMAEYEKLVEELNEPGKEYSESDKEKAAKAMGRYHSLLLKNGIEQSATLLNELKAIVPSYLEGLLEGLDENTEQLGKSLEGLLNNEELEKTLTELGEKLENIFGGLGENP